MAAATKIPNATPAVGTVAAEEVSCPFLLRWLPSVPIEVGTICPSDVVRLLYEVAFFPVSVGLGKVTLLAMLSGTVGVYGISVTVPLDKGTDVHFMGFELEALARAELMKSAKF